MNVITSWMRAGREAGRMLLNTVLPPQCLSCGTIVAAPGQLCAACFGRFTFITAPYCGVCGVPLDPSVTEDLICGACVANRPAFSRARAVFLYDAESRPLVLKLKHGDRTDMAVHLAKWMSRAGRDLIEAADVIVPVPLHKWRLMTRTYNQSALLARAIGVLGGRKVIPDNLKRIRSTPSQGGLGRAARRRNVAKAFTVGNAELFNGRKILLVDDVLTSGATANACAEALLSAGASTVDVLALARVPHPADPI